MAFSQASMAKEMNMKKLIARMTLPEDELHDFFSNYFPKLGVTMQDLKVPKSDRMLAIYEAFLNDFGHSLEYLNQCPMAADHSEFVENQANDNTIFMTSFYVIMKRLLECTGFNEFLFKDLTDPKPKRTRLILSQLKALWEFVNHMYNNMYLPIKDTLIQESESMKENMTKIEALKKKINKIRAKQAEDAPEIKQLKERTAVLDEQLQEKLQIKVDMHAQLESSKVQLVNLKAQLSKLTVQSAELREQEEDLDRRTFQSPEKETRARQQMERRELDERNRKDEKREKMYETNKLVDRLNVMKVELEDAMATIQDRQVDIEKLKDIQQQVEKLQKFLEDKENIIQTQQNEVKRCKRLLAIKSESNAKLLIQQPRKMAAINESVEQLQRDYSLLKQQHSQCSEVKSQQVETLAEIRERIAKNKRIVEEIKTEVAVQYSNLLTKVESRHKEMMDYLVRNKAALLED